MSYNWRDAERPTPRPLPPPSRRRDKPQLSCMSCRSRKLKCDRNQPCSNCSKRQQSCVYVPSRRGNQVLRDTQARSDSSTNLQERICRLEQIVEDLANANDCRSDSCREDEQYSANPPTHPATGDVNPDSFREPCTGDITDSVGRINISERETSYVGPAHWQEVVNEISDIKDQLEGFTDTSGDGLGSNSAKPELLLGLSRHVSKQDILRSIPPRQTCDSLISYFFEAMELATLSIHRPTFEKEYAGFWMNPSAMRPAWLGILFAMFSLATHFRIVCGNEPEPVSMLGEYRDLYTERAAHCLILADYTQPGQYTLEALILYFVVEHAVGKAGPFRVALLFDIIVRSAMRMGYHRDPSHYPEISVFHGELRRRAWILIRHMDIVVSSWVGLPRIVDSRHADTRPPRNLLDHDLDENMTELPPSRPEEAAVSYATMKTDTLILFANVVDEVSCMNRPPYSRIMELDRVLHDFYASVRSHFQLSEETMKTNPTRFLRRLMLNVIYQKARCVLHRNYISSKREEHRYSRYSCVDAAMRILTGISMSYDGDMPNSSLYPFAWSLPAAFTNDLLLASMIVCVDLERTVRGIRETELPPGDLLEWTKEEKIEALRKAYKTLRSPSLGPSEVCEATKIIRIVLENTTKTVVQSQRRQESPYLNQQLPQNTTDRDGQGLIEPASATVEDESPIPASSAQPSWAISPPVEYAMPVDNAGEFFAASMMDPVQFMMEVPLDFGTGFWTAPAPSTVEGLPDMPWDFDGNSQFNGNL